MENNFYNQNNNNNIYNNENQYYNPQNNPQPPNGYYNNPNIGYTNQNGYYNNQNRYRNPYPYYYVVPKKTVPLSQEEKNAKKKATVSMILGILSLAFIPSFLLFPFALFIPQIVSIILGIKAKGEYKRLLKKNKMAASGIIMSSVSFVISAILTIVMTVLLYIPIGSLNIPANMLIEDQEEVSEYIEDHLYDYYSDLFGIDRNEFEQFDGSYDDVYNFPDDFNYRS